MYLKDNQVMILDCEEYNTELIKTKINEGLKPWGGIKSFVKPEQKVLLKVNLLMAKDPEDAVTTHPALVKALVELIEEVGAEAIIGDSPGGPFNKKMLQRIYRKTGMQAVADSTKAELNWDFSSVQSSFTEGKVLKSLTLGKFIQNADLIINLPKFKSHGLTKMTGGVKNMFGAIPGLLKAEYHLNMPEITDFANALLDIALATVPTLTIMDGIVGMEGEGPSGGEPLALNKLLLSPNPCALDVIMAELVGVDPLTVPTIEAAKERGLIYQLEDTKVLGSSIKQYSFTTPNIDNSAELLQRYSPSFLKPVAKWLSKSLQPKPIFNQEKCVQCGICIKSCPPKIIEQTENCVEADLNECIRCFCCQELCPQEAVAIHRSLLGKILFSK